MVIADPTATLLTVCEKGYGKRTPFGPNAEPGVGGQESGVGGQESEGEAPAEPEDLGPGTLDVGPAEEESEESSSSARYPTKGRGGIGVRDIKTTERNGPVIGVVPVREGDDIMLMTAGGMVNRTHVSEIRLIGRNTQGVRIMNLHEGDKIASIAKIANEDEPETAASETPSVPPAMQPTPGEPATGETATGDEPAPPGE